MTVNEMKEWLADKPGSSLIVHGRSGLDNIDELSWKDMGLIHEREARVDPRGEQGELFDDPQ